MQYGSSERTSSTRLDFHVCAGTSTYGHAFRWPVLSRKKKYLRNTGAAGGHVCGNVGAGFPNPRNTLLIAPRVSQNRAGTPVTSRSPPVPPAIALYPSLFLRFSVPRSLPSLAVPLCLSVCLSLSVSLSLFSPSTFTGGIRNGEHAAVQRLREPHATTPAPNHHPSFPRLCHAWCQPVWPPTRTTFSSFPPLTSLSLSSSLSFVLIHLLFFPSHATSRRCFFSLFSSSLPFFFIVRRGHLRHRLRLLPFVPLHRASPFSTGRVPSVCCYLCPSGSRIRASLTCMPVSYMSSASFHPPRRHHLSLLRPGFVRSFVRLLLPPLFVSKPSLSLSLSLSLASSLYYTRLV